jgi:MoaA/NifB/PqqE/SkfB family radical SAM enzyme
MADYFSEISYLMIETNSSCNLKCAFCNREDLKAKGLREPKNVTVEEFESMLDVFQNCKIDTVKLQGISEPFLHPKFSSMAKLVREKFPKAFVLISTNCQYKFERSTFKETTQYVDMIYLSIDGIERVYEESRAGAKWDVLTEFLETLKKEVPIEVRQSKLHISFVLTQNNYHQLPEIYKLKEKYDLASVRINLAQDWNEDSHNKQKFPEVLRESIKPYQKDIKGVAGWEYKDCFWPFSALMVDVFGNVRQCIVNTSQEPISNILDKGFKDEYNNGDFYKEIREALKNNTAVKSCETCDYKFLSPILEDIFEGERVDTPRTFKIMDEKS